MASTRQADALPEHLAYRDTGCEVHPSCLTCPLPQCRFDTHGWLSKEAYSARDAKIIAARDSLGLSVSELAKRFDLSQRTIHRALKG